MKTISLPVGGITIELTEAGCVDGGNTWVKSQGTISSELHDPDNPEYGLAIDGLESLILAHACVGIDVSSPAYVEGIQTAVDAITNNLA